VRLIWSSTRSLQINPDERSSHREGIEAIFVSETGTIRCAYGVPFHMTHARRSSDPWDM
jgi:hypothetical protein